jgi:hypothetical protein
MPGPITPLPTPPSTDDPSNFESLGDEFLGALPGLAEEINEFAASLNSLSTTTASVTSVAIGTGTKNFLVETGKSLFPSMSYKMGYDANNWMLGDIISYDSGAGALSIDVDTVRGSGTYAAWVGTLSFNGQIETPQYADESVTPAKLSDDAFISIVGDSKNLIITNNSGTPNSQIDIDADEIILKDTDGRAYLAEAVNLTANIAASGANGLDTGAEANSTWYYVWVIYNGTNVAGLLSASSTAPTLPSGYTYKALMGAIYNDGSSNFIKIYQTGKRVNTTQAVATSTAPGLSYVSVSLGAIIPPNAKRVTGNENIQFGPSLSGTGYLAPTASDDYARSFVYISGSGTSIKLGIPFNIPVVEPQTVYTKRTGSAVSDYQMRIDGWES